MQATRANSTMLLTGATGHIGGYLLARLLARGERVVVLLRGGNGDMPRLCRLLSALDCDGDRATSEGRLIALRGDVCASIDALPRGITIDAAIHGAACTRFERDHNGDPHRTNVGGTSRLLEWLNAHRVKRLHLVSTAYVCGRTDGGIVAERIETRAPNCHNDYERSKWEAEQRCAAWAAQGAERTLTVLRPSIVVGEHASGRTTKFSGFYLTVRAAEAVAELRRRGGAKAASMRLAIQGRCDSRQNIVPVDYVAAMIDAIAHDPAQHGRVHHIVHSAPPTNGAIRSAIESCFELDGIEFVEPEKASCRRNVLERAFDRMAASVEPYIADAPRFDRCNAERVERAHDLWCPSFDHSALLRLCRFAASARWENEPVPTLPVGEERDEAIARYFHEFLPHWVPTSRIARMHGLSATVRFVLTDVPDGQWVCRFEQGRLAEVHRGSNGLREEFGYRTTRDVFARAVAGTLEPQEAFLGRQAEVFGDIEQALKMAMVLREFNRECPFTPEVEVAHA